MLNTLKPAPDSLNLRKSHQYKPPTDHQKDIIHDIGKSFPKMSSDVISWPFQVLRCQILPSALVVLCIKCLVAEHHEVQAQQKVVLRIHIEQLKRACKHVLNHKMTQETPL